MGFKMAGALKRMRSLTRNYHEFSCTCTTLCSLYYRKYSSTRCFLPKGSRCIYLESARANNDRPRCSSKAYILARRYTTLPPSKQFNFIADAAAKAAPAVVFVEVEIGQGGLFGAKGIGAGSGFIVTDYGIVLTNAHVVHQASRLQVKTSAGEVKKADIIDIDPVADLAVLEFKPDRKLPTVQMGNSSSVRPGEWVVALGSPLNLSNTITAGIVSAVHRGGKDIGLRKGDMAYIQTDAAINRGNSGGPLINLDGEVIGINTMTLVNTTGISFAIPVDRAKAFLLQSLENQERRVSQRGSLGLGASRPFIGIKMMTLGPEIEGQLRNQIPDFPDVSHGVLVVDVVEGSPAFRAGLHIYDVVTEVDDVILSSSSQLHDIVSRGRPFRVKVIRRGGQKLLLQVSPQIIRGQ